MKDLKEVQVFLLPNKLTDDIQYKVRNDVEIKLKMVGIKVNPNASEVLCINVLTNDIGGNINGYYGSIEVVLRHPRVLIERNGIVQTDAIIWESFIQLIHGPKEGFGTRCRDTVKDQVDSFINDFLSINGGIK